MNKNLLYVKLTHTIIWLFFVIAIFYILYAGIADKINYLVYLAIGAVIIEGLVLLLNKGRCPLTDVAEKYTDDHAKDNFDIFLPNWLAKYNKLIFTSIFLLGVIIVLYRQFI